MMTSLLKLHGLHLLLFQYRNHCIICTKSESDNLPVMDKLSHANSPHDETTSGSNPIM
jgi:hypothetical protein